VDKPTILPVIPRIGHQVRLSLAFAKMSTELRAFICSKLFGQLSVF